MTITAVDIGEPFKVGDVILAYHVVTDPAESIPYGWTAVAAYDLGPKPEGKATATPTTWHFDDGWMICDIDDCGFTVEMGEGRAMVYHQEETHGGGLA